MPVDAYYGVQTVRAMENFVISSTPISAFPEYIKALGYIKKACALANMEFKILDKQIGGEVIKASEEMIAGKMDDQVYDRCDSGGAGTSVNMNANSDRQPRPRAARQRTRRL